MADLTHTEARQLIQAASIGKLRPVDRAACNQHMETCPQCQEYAADLGALQSILTRTLRPLPVNATVVRSKSSPIRAERPTTDYDSANPALAPRFSWRQTAGTVGLIVILLVGANWLLQVQAEPNTAISATPIPSIDGTTTVQQEAADTYRAGHLTKAVTLYQQIADSAPQNINNQIQLAQAQVMAGKVADGIATAHKAVTLDPNNSNAHAVLAMGLNWDGQTDKASDEAVRAMQLDPNNAQALAYYADVLMEQQLHYTLAGDAAQQALKLDPYNVAAQSAYGYYLASVGSYEPSKHVLYEALKLEPANPDLHGRLGLVFFKDLDYGHALSELGCVVDSCQTRIDLPNVSAQANAPIVERAPLTHRTLPYYYTYSSVLTALSTPANDNCQRVSELNQRIRLYLNEHPAESFVSDILIENEAICAYAAQPSFICGSGMPNCRDALAAAQQKLGFQIRLPDTLLYGYTLSDLNYNPSTQRLMLSFTKGTDTLYIFQGAIPKSGDYLHWDLSDPYLPQPQPLKGADIVGQFVPGVVGENPLDESDVSVRLYWQADGVEYLIYRTVPVDGSRAEFVALADEMIAQKSAVISTSTP